MLPLIALLVGVFLIAFFFSLPTIIHNLKKHPEGE